MLPGCWGFWLSESHCRLGVWVTPIVFSFHRRLLPEMGSVPSPLKGLPLLLLPVLACFSLSLLALSPGAQPDFCASPPTARGPGGPQDSPLQGEDLQEGEALWHLPTGHHPGGLHLQRWVTGGAVGEGERVFAEGRGLGSRRGWDVLGVPSGCLVLIWEERLSTRMASV